MLDLGLFDGDRNRRILMVPIDPIVLTKNEQASRCSLEEAARRDFNRVFRAVRVPAGYLASFQRQARILAFRFYFVIGKFECAVPRGSFIS
jgi:hypothetical protein